MGEFFGSPPTLFYGGTTMNDRINEILRGAPFLTSDEIEERLKSEGYEPIHGWIMV